mmetsp:Transcript_17619/g.30345  ORF Transcript_17619/g.30345 Transcript_17619/m.30345 type:complete len:147 (+) Transcript_17619:57-497(+)
MKNLVLSDNGGSIIEFSSQYHHESRCSNLLIRDPGLVWFSSVAEPLPQHVVFKLQTSSEIKRVGIYLHGENNQSPKHITISLSLDGKTWEQVVDAELEHRGGDHLFDLNTPVLATYAKLTVTENFGGSGIFVSKFYVFGEPRLAGG